MDLLFNYWRDFPPMHLLVGAYFGFGVRRSQPTATDIGFLKGLENQGVKSHDNLPLVIQEWLAMEVLPKMKTEVN